MLNDNIASKHKVLLENRPTFLKRLAVLLREGYTFHDGLYLLLPHHLKEYDRVLVEVEEDFKAGFGVTQIFDRFGFSSSMLLPVSIAEMDGRLADTLEEMAERLRKSEEKKKKLKNLLVYPIALFVFVAVLLMAFRKFFLPNMEMLAMSQQTQAGGFVAALPAIVSKIPDAIIGMVVISASLVGIMRLLYKNMTPTSKIRFCVSFPVIRMFFMMMKTRDFASEMGSLLQSGLSMQHALDVLINQQLDVVLSTMTTNVKEQVIYGEPLHSAIEMTDGLMGQLAAFAKHGADSGHLPKELLIYSEHLEETIDRKLTTILALLQPVLFGVIALCILAAYLTLLLPVYGMMDNL